MSPEIYIRLSSHQFTQQIFQNRFKDYDLARTKGLWNPRTDIDWAHVYPTNFSRDLLEKSWVITSEECAVEEVGMVVAAQLLREIDDPGIRYSLATQVSDEAKHSEVFARYAIAIGGTLYNYPPEPQSLANTVLSVSDPLDRFVIHTALEWLALEELRFLRVLFSGTQLAEIYRHVLLDEARHVRMGMTQIKRLLQENTYKREKVVDSAQFAAHLSHIDVESAYKPLENLLPGKPKVQQIMNQAHSNRITALIGKGGDNQ